MGILPLEFINGQTADSIGLNGYETYSIEMPMKVSYFYNLGWITIISEREKS